ncbi:MAG: hypothetical protein ACD_49C00067G0048 [uncultured bacterium (gcode 4)]|uniref:Uncharacterized protein n=1 Tax=uncultured bacterium (gcode 4) TaxID=1234023 RepID=K2AW80_9BACT|nr:MAG: hypothetical protein ACD_49C00067G0048 [uncultured bacterium (gcode 4)]
MFLVLIWIYTIIMAIVWGFFLVAKIHFYKFRDYSLYIAPVTKFMTIFLLLLTIFWYYQIYQYSTSSWDNNTTTIQDSAIKEIY